MQIETPTTSSKTGLHGNSASMQQPTALSAQAFHMLVATLICAVVVLACSGALVLAGSAQAASSTCTVRFYDCPSGTWQLIAQADNVPLSCTVNETFQATGAPTPARAANSQSIMRFRGWSAWPGGATTLSGPLGNALSQTASQDVVIDCYSVFASERRQPTGVAAIANGSYQLKADGTATYLRPVQPRTVKTVRVPVNVTCFGQSYRVTAIGASAFEGCKRLKTLSVAASVNEIGANACRGCTRLKKVTGMSGLEHIGKRTFCECKRLRAFVCNSHVLKSVRAKAFAHCATLTRVRLSSPKLTAIGKNAFAHCPSLQSFSYRSNSITKKTLKQAGIR